MPQAATTQPVKLEITPTQASGDIVIRSGEAAQVYDPVKVKHRGTLGAPAEYISKAAGIDPNRSSVTADFTNRTITLRVNEADQFGAEVVGALEIDPDLAKLRINKPGAYYTNRELAEVIKFMGVYFVDREAHTKMLTNLRQFEAKIDTVLQDQNNRKGSILYQRASAIKTELQLDFKLLIPVFAGHQPKAINVEICIDAETGAVRFWLESIELQNIIKTETDEIFEKELENFSAFPIIRKY